MTRGEVNRREFLKGSGAVATVAAASPVLTSVPAAAAGANDRIRFAVIGCGGQGRRSHIARFPKGVNTEIVYVCDPDEERRNQASTEAGGARPVDDLRRILEDTSIDAVTIATPDHWHTPAAILALDAGKHVYLEKPCSHNLREGRLLVEAARRSGRVLQHGTQARSSRGFVEAIRMLHEGVIGDVLVAKAWNVQKRRNIGRERPGPTPAGFDYDLWLGPAPRVPFQKNRHHYSWHWWYDFGTGDLGNDGVHEFDMARWGLGLDVHPAQVAVAGGKFYFDDDQEFPDTVTATFDYPGKGGVGERRQLVFEMRIWSGNHPYDVDGGVEFLGDRRKDDVQPPGAVPALGPGEQAPRTTAGRHAEDGHDEQLPDLGEGDSRAGRSHGRRRDGALVHLAVPPGQHRREGGPVLPLRSGDRADRRRRGSGRSARPHLPEGPLGDPPRGVTRLRADSGQWSR